jgi:signal peptidase
MVQKRFALLVGISLVLLYTFISINWNPLFSMDKPKDFLVFFTSRVFVSLALNSYLTYVSYLAGPMPSIIYVLVTQAPIWFMNPLPNLSWLTTSVLGISFPVLSLDIIMNAYHKQTKVIKPHEYQGSNPYSWIVIAAFSVIMVWFSVGLFPVSPSLVITKSMQPGIDPGDVVIIKKVDTQSLKTGDIIKYWDGKCFITHRIVDIYTEEDKTYFITKGDANSLEDDPVSPEQVRGVLMFTIPKIGKLPLWIRTQLAIS